MTSDSEPGQAVQSGFAPLKAAPGHLFNQLPFYDVVDTVDSVVMDLHHRDDIVNGRGALQGGLIATLIDIAAGRLAMKHAPGGSIAGTANMSIYFLAPVMTGPARATATLVRAGRRLIVVAVDVVDVSNDKLAVRATLSFAGGASS